MGIVIDYQGSLDGIQQLDSLIADVRAFCQLAGWPFTEVEEQISGIALGTAEDFMDPPPGQKRKRKAPTKVEDWPEEETFRRGGLTIRFDSKNPNLIEETWKGIVVHPPGTESLAVTFDGHGRLCRFMKLSQDWVKGPLRNEKHYLCFPLFCKTTGEPDQHAAICALLKMLRRKYIRDLKVEDDTGYYKSGDLAKLGEEHAIMSGVIGVIKNNPAFLKSVLKAAGIDDAAAEGAVPLPDEMLAPIRGARRKGASPKPKKPTVH